MFARAFAIVAALFSALPALAGDDESFDRSGWYAGLGAQGQYYLLQDEVEQESLGLLTVGNTVGFMARGGYRLTSWFAAELAYEYAPGFALETARQIDLGAIDPSLPVVLKGTELVGVDGHTVTLNAKFLLPVWRIHPYLMLGLGGSLVKIEDRFGLVDASKVAVAGRLGVGGDIYITKNLLFYLELSGLLTSFDLKDPTAKQNL
ncbi:MAG: porin family protein, partial [Candidatus Krumholzibacteria bacterium]|nr:porin family protein [Candidatus Krumholzibacteria bacterium]